MGEIRSYNLVSDIEDEHLGLNPIEDDDVKDVELATLTQAPPRSFM